MSLDGDKGAVTMVHHPDLAMTQLAQILHLAAAVLWLGGMAFVLLALRPAALAVLPLSLRLPLMTAVLQRFFVMVWISIATLLLTGAYRLLEVGMKTAPLGWHIMLGLGWLMMAIFGYIYFSPFKQLKAATVAQDWPQAGRQMAKIHPLVMLNFGLGWCAVTIVTLLR